MRPQTRSIITALIIKQTASELLRRGYVRIAAVKGRDYQKLVRSMAPGYRALFNNFATQEQLMANFRAVEEILKTGSVEALIYRPVNLIDSNLPQHTLTFYQRFRAWLAEGMRRSGENFTDIINRRLRIPASRELIFSMANQRVIEFLNTEALEFAVRLADSRTQTLRDTLQFISREVIRENLTFREATAFMKQSMTITPKQAEWVRKAYRGALDKGLTKSEALRIAKDKSQRFKQIRAETQIRTEMKRADEAGKNEAMRQAIDRGLVQGEVRRLWIKVVEGNNWDSSNINDGTTAGMDELFPSGDYEPNEINERCEIQYLALRAA